MPFSIPLGAASVRLGTRSLSDLMARVAAVVGAKDNPDEVQAGPAVQMALMWLTEFNWEWYRATSTFTTTAGTAVYTIAARTRTVHHMRVSSSDPRPVRFIRRDQYDNVVWDQSSNGRFTHYTLENLGSDTQVTLLPTPNAAETVTYEYFRQPAIPTSDPGIVDMSEEMELPVVLYAQALVGQWRGKGQAWVRTQIALAESARDGAFANDSKPYDEDVRLISMEEHMSPAPSLNVEPSYYERGNW